MILKKGLYVIHPKREEWGVGKVIDSIGNNVYSLFFEHGGFRNFDKKNNPLVLSEIEFNKEIFENLNDANTKTFVTISDLEKHFLEDYEDGFSGKIYKDRERDYKDKAHSLAIELLGIEEYSKLLEDKDYEEIFRRAYKIITATNLIFPNEKMAFKDGFTNDLDKEAFANILFDVLYKKENEELEFERFALFLNKINAGKWTIVSYLQFFINPYEYIFIKPTITQKIAEISAYDIQYTSQINWNTYNRVQKFSKYLKNNISSLFPKDMIDVQSFIWCVSDRK